MLPRLFLAVIPLWLVSMQRVQLGGVRRLIAPMPALRQKSPTYLMYLIWRQLAPMHSTFLISPTSRHRHPTPCLSKKSSCVPMMGVRRLVDIMRVYLIISVKTHYGSFPLHILLFAYSFTSNIIGALPR